jgi:predicted Zn finger-like uncharacterized protein
MILQCNSCKKSFVVPDSAITQIGRLVQCSVCGNKWTQYPIKSEAVKNEKKSINLSQKLVSKPIIKKVKTKKVKKKKSIDAYSPEYLKKKHGIRIIDPSSVNENLEKKSEKIENSFWYTFYKYTIVIFFSLSLTIGIIYLAEEIIIINFPNLELYISYIFETLNNIKVIFLDIISNYK